MLAVCSMIETESLRIKPDELFVLHVRIPKHHYDYFKENRIDIPEFVRAAFRKGMKDIKRLKKG